MQLARSTWRDGARWQRDGSHWRHRPEVGFRVGADVGEAGWVGEVGGLARVGVGPALALLEFYGVVVEELVDGDRGKHYFS